MFWNFTPEQVLPCPAQGVSTLSSDRSSSLELEGREAMQLESLSREGGIDRAIGIGAQALSPWRQLPSGVRERYPSKEDVSLATNPARFLHPAT